MNSTEPLGVDYWIGPEPTGPGDSGRSRAELRRFGFVMAGVLALLSGYFFWRGHAVAPWMAGLGGMFLLSALVVPRVLDPVERVWLAVGDVLGAMVSRIILILAFYFLITPIGLLIRVFSGETLGKRPDPDMQSYWVPVEPDGPGSRPAKPF